MPLLDPRPMSRAGNRYFCLLFVTARTPYRRHTNHAPATAKTATVIAPLRNPA